MSVIRTRQTRLALCFVALIAVMFALIWGLHTIEFLPGEPLPTAQLGARTELGGAVTNWWAVEAIFPVALRVFIIFGLAACAIFAVIFPAFRRYLIALPWAALLVFVLFLSFYILVANVSPVEQPAAGEKAPDEAALEKDEGLPGPIEVEIPPVRPPKWGVIMAAIGIALFAAGIGLFAISKLFRSRRSLLDQLGELASNAATRIRAGDDPREVVLRCYKEMSALLSRVESTPNFAHLTPREFAHRLRARGMRDDHVDRLTGIFEQVRYGRRQGREFADKALLSLEAIERTCAHGEAV